MACCSRLYTKAASLAIHYLKSNQFYLRFPKFEILYNSWTSLVLPHILMSQMTQPLNLPNGARQSLVPELLGYHYNSRTLKPSPGVHSSNNPGVMLPPLINPVSNQHNNYVILPPIGQKLAGIYSTAVSPDRSLNTNHLHQKLKLPSVDEMLPRTNQIFSRPGESFPEGSPELVPVLPLELKTTPPARKRKKTQCPKCSKYFSNLATHKSTHLGQTSKRHVCEVCLRGFSRLNDLSRHTKSHWKATLDPEHSGDSVYNSDENNHLIFKCPYLDSPNCAKKCHSTGIFSRGDTFKNHLKALHFQYPLGTKKKERRAVSGICKSCSKPFSSADDWLTNHVMNNQCPGLMLEEFHPS